MHKTFSNLKGFFSFEFNNEGESIADHECFFSSGYCTGDGEGYGYFDGSGYGDGYSSNYGDDLGGGYGNGYGMDFGGDRSISKILTTEEANA
jgi:hypothetical protein